MSASSEKAPRAKRRARSPRKTAGPSSGSRGKAMKTRKREGVLEFRARKITPKQFAKLKGKPTRDELEQIERERELIKSARKEGQRIARLARF